MGFILIPGESILPSSFSEMDPIFMSIAPETIFVGKIVKKPHISKSDSACKNAAPNLKETRFLDSHGIPFPHQWYTLKQFSRHKRTGFIRTLRY
jgi:hypothetical protein